MARPILLPLSRCIASSLVGGKDSGLARLLGAGFAVPNGCCVTTAAYHQALHAVGFSPLGRWQQVILCTCEDRSQLLQESRQIMQRADQSLRVEAFREEMRRIADLSDRRWAVRSSATNEDMAQA